MFVTDVKNQLEAALIIRDNIEVSFSSVVTALLTNSGTHYPFNLQQVIVPQEYNNFLKFLFPVFYNLLREVKDTTFY